MLSDKAVAKVIDFRRQEVRPEEMAGMLSSGDTAN
jgi:hypothetical protein